MFGKGNNKLSLSSTAGEILQKVNKAISRSEKPEDEEEVLELTEMVSQDEILSTENLPPIEELKEEVKVKVKNEVEKQLENKTSPKKVKTTPKKESPKKEKNTNTVKNTKGKNMNKKLVSSDTAEATSAMFTKLKKSAQNKKASSSLKFDSGLTMEELTAELLKPYLSEWLDKNLPTIVKEAVEKEVEKLLPSDD